MGGEGQARFSQQNNAPAGSGWKIKPCRYPGDLKRNWQQIHFNIKHVCERESPAGLGCPVLVWQDNGGEKSFLSGQHGFLRIQDNVFLDGCIWVKWPDPGPDYFSLQAALTCPTFYWLLILVPLIQATMRFLFSVVSLWPKIWPQIFPLVHWLFFLFFLLFFSSS